MAFVGTILQEAVKIRKSFMDDHSDRGYFRQLKTLDKLLDKAENTAFGREHDFKSIRKSADPVSAFQEAVGIYDYDSLFEKWWHRSLNGEEDVCWPGTVKYFAKTSGTSAASSKRIPVTQEMIKAMRRTSMRQVLTLSELNVSKNFYEKSILMLGGSSQLDKVNGHYEGDLSGILATKIPIWFYKFYKPGNKISREKDWLKKIEMITEKAEDWDIGIIAGVPAWIQLLLERIIEKYDLNHIHEIWPNFTIFVHGGVSLSPYRKSFDKLLGKELTYLETYLASEGFLAYQNADNRNMEMVIDNGIFYEFIPFNENNFTLDGEVKENAKVLTLNEVEKGVDYAVLISTCSGAWRYLIGDTIKFTDLENIEITITGRTKMFLSLCGEHLSVDNMNHAISTVADDLNININEYTVSGDKHDNLFAHKWYIGAEEEVDEETLREKLDEKLKEINDDYATERRAALKEIIVKVIPTDLFYDWMEEKGKLGGQNKFPRVLKAERLSDWEEFIDKRMKNA